MLTAIGEGLVVHSLDQRFSFGHRPREETHEEATPRKQGPQYVYIGGNWRSWNCGSPPALESADPFHVRLLRIRG